MNRKSTDFFVCMSGLRQGENLSPILFSLYRNNLEKMFEDESNGIEIEYIDDDLYFHVKLLLILYADDTVILTKNEVDLQNNLDQFLPFCNEWKLNINFS